MVVRKDDLQMKILLVEDDKTIASDWNIRCSKIAFLPFFAMMSNLQKVLTEHIDQFALCLFDLSLPDGSGYELCNMVKERRDIPVIF